MGSSSSGHARVGISGWRYAGWRALFYPEGLPQRQELAYAADRLTTIEINGTFYALQRPESFQAWRDGTPDGFVFAVKGGRFVTHMKRLTDAPATLANFFASGVLALDTSFGPLLWQLPPTLRFEPDRIETFLAALPRTTVEAGRLAERHDERLDGRAWTAVDTDRPLRHAVEVRHESYRDPRFVDLLREHGVAVVVADTAGRWPLLDQVTSDDLVYVRLHGDRELYTSGYGDDALDRWAARVRGWADGSDCPDGRGRDVFVYFDNDVKAHAPFDAMALARRLT